MVNSWLNLIVSILINPVLKTVSCHIYQPSSFTLPNPDKNPDFHPWSNLRAYPGILSRFSRRPRCLINRQFFLDIKI